MKARGHKVEDPERCRESWQTERRRSPRRWTRATPRRSAPERHPGAAGAEDLLARLLGRSPPRLSGSLARQKSVDRPLSALYPRGRSHPSTSPGTAWRGRRVHRSATGEKTGVTREKTDWLGNKYRETQAPDGSVKSKSREKTDWLGNRYTESRGGSSDTKHTTRTETSWWGKKYRKTE